VRLLVRMLTPPSLFPTYCNAATSFGNFCTKGFVISQIITKKQH